MVGVEAALMTITVPSTTYMLPSEYAAELASEYVATVGNSHKKAFGQFFTPAELGVYLASLSTFTGPEARLLDPGFGTGVLACALAEHLVETSPSLVTIHLDVYELDAGVLPYAQASLAYLAQWLTAQHVMLQAQLQPEDFILSAFEAELQNPALIIPRYDVVIANPPYFKVYQSDARNALLRPHQLDQPNIYALFVIQATLLTRPGGELLFLIPRSFCSGLYFKKFRIFLYRYLRLDVFHLFHSRDQAFKKDAVQQENIILKATRQDAASEHDYPLLITSSAGTHDLAAVEQIQCSLHEIVDLHSREKVLFLPTTPVERTIIKLLKTWRHRLHDFGIHVSTGPVVAFRTTDYLRITPEEGYAPLFWVDCVQRGSIDWPKPPSRPQYLVPIEGRRALLLPTRNYVMLRRFSAKDDKHRLIAAPFLAAKWRQYEGVGIENKLNYFYSRTGELTDAQTIGLAALLNSDLYDTFFRIFNGNTQVSATEARAFPMPPLATIEKIGLLLLKQGNSSMQSIVNNSLIHN